MKPRVTMRIRPNQRIDDDGRLNRLRAHASRTIRHFRSLSMRWAGTGRRRRRPIVLPSLPLHWRRSPLEARADRIADHRDNLVAMFGEGIRVVIVFPPTA